MERARPKSSCFVIAVDVLICAHISPVHCKDIVGVCIGVGGAVCVVGVYLQSIVGGIVVDVLLFVMVSVVTCVDVIDNWFCCCSMPERIVLISVGVDVIVCVVGVHLEGIVGGIVVVVLLFVMVSVVICVDVIDNIICWYPVPGGIVLIMLLWFVL